MDYKACTQLGDAYGEAVANNNMSNSLQMVGEYEEAIHCNENFLKFSIDSKNDECRSKALYSLAKAHHEMAKHLGAITRQSSGQFPPQIENVLDQAAMYYKDSLEVSRELNNLYLQCEILGNLGNVHYLLGNFRKSIKLQTEKIKLSTDLSNLKGKMRGYINRGNCFIVMESVELAIEDFTSALSLSKDVQDKSVEKKMHYALGNSYFLLNQFTKAKQHICDFIDLSQQSNDQFGTARSHMCLALINCKEGAYVDAKVHAIKHLELAQELNDDAECDIARRNIRSISEMLNFINDDIMTTSTTKHEKITITENGFLCDAYIPSLIRVMTNEGEHIKEVTDQPMFDNFHTLLYKYSTEKKQLQAQTFNIEDVKEDVKKITTLNDNQLIKVLSAVECQRMNDQRATYQIRSDKTMDNNVPIDDLVPKEKINLKKINLTKHS